MWPWPPAPCRHHAHAPTHATMPAAEPATSAVAAAMHTQKSFTRIHNKIYASQCHASRLLHSDNRVVPHQPHGLSTAAMAGMELSFQMPAGIDGAVRMPTTTQNQTLCSRLQHTTGQLNHKLSLFALDPANTARGCSCLLPSNDRVVPHQPHRTFTCS